VENDINIFDTDEVLWAVATRCDPATDIEILQGCWDSPLDPMLSPEKKAKGDFTSSRAIIDATRPYHWKSEFPQDTQADPKLRELVHKKWNHLFRGL
jgi:4-hydroxy-3-polyprenylbenzoate decarboxylase